MDIWNEDGYWCRSARCGHIVKSTNKGNINTANKKNRLCAECARLPENNPMYGRVGESNPFYGKKHTPENIAKFKLRDTSACQTEEFKAKMRLVAANQDKSKINYSIKDSWIRKYGVEEGEKRWAEFLASKKGLQAGSKNPMYGKPSPNGAGNGWKGYYQDRFFRSLRELTFMVNNPTYVSAESNEWRAKYVTPNGVARTTIPDYVDKELKVVVECKPQRLHDTPSVQVKVNAIRLLCESRGYEYKLIDPGVLDREVILDLVKKEEIVFIGDYLEKVKSWSA